MQPVDAFGAPVMVIIDPAEVYSYRQQRYTNMKSDLAQKLITFGFLQPVFGILCIVFQIISLKNLSWRSTSLGHGIWGGVMFMITGPFGIIGGKRRIKGCVIAFNVLSILSALSSGVMLSFSILEAFSSNNVIVGMQSMIALFALAEGIVAILSSVVCCTIGACCDDCNGNCCCPSSFELSQSMMITNQQLMRITNQRLMRMTNQQPMMITNQEPMMTVNQQPMPCPYSYEIQQPSAERYGHMGKGYDNSEYSYA